MRCPHAPPRECPKMLKMLPVPTLANAAVTMGLNKLAHANQKYELQNVVDS